MKNSRVPELISEIKDELTNIEILVNAIIEVYREMPRNLKKRKVYEESLALKLHNFYTGCERIFQKISDDINGGVPVSKDWHKRLLKIMSLDIERIRPAVISKETQKSLEEYLAFRHVVRNIYGFEIDEERLQILIKKLPEVSNRFKKEVDDFIEFLHKMKEK